MTKLMQSYVWYGEQCFFVSTINRESSAMLGPGIYAETMVWEHDETINKQGRLIGQDEGARGTVTKHIRICQRLIETGKPFED